MRQLLALAALIVATIAVDPVQAAGRQYYVLGDSFVDAGNAFIGTGGLVARPQDGYFQGRFTNGPTFADLMQAAETGQFTTASLAGGDNFAVGGARAAGDAAFPPFIVPGLPNQRGAYSLKYGANVFAGGIYMLSFGNNDVNAIQSSDTYGLTVAQYSALYTANIVNTVSSLGAGGASKIIVLGVPNPLEPEGLALQAQLNAGLAPLQSLLGDRLVVFDFFSFFGAMIANPLSFGLPANTDFVTPCESVRPVVNGMRDCTGFFSFDGTHPTAPVHRALARAIALQANVAVVPEPESWALMIAGFLVVGAAVRRARVPMPA
jgi:phospholipase/lecithinase/hemolysin